MTTFFLVFLFLLPFLSPTHSQIAYPCHTKKEHMGANITCTVITLPKNLCSSCPLRTPRSDGKFAKCWDIFDTSSPTCLPALEQYASFNPCDTIRVRAVQDFAISSENDTARGILDYFLYSICEQCCDCIPMGANDDLYTHYLASHSARRPTLYSTTRGNCPAHAVYDVCNVLPHITRFTNIDDNDVAVMNKDEFPKACPMLREWLYSKESNAWQENPKTSLQPPLDTFLDNMLQKLQCAKKDIWKRCYALEAAQDHLGVPEDIPEVHEKQSSISSTKNTPSHSGRDVKVDIVDTESVTPDPSPTAERAASCFPSSATVQLRTGVKKRMSALCLGDEVLVSTGDYSPVYLFSHRDANALGMHVRIQLASGATLTLTGGHLLHVNGRLRRAGEIVVGDVLQTANGESVVLHVASVLQQGLYNPHTIKGDVVVDGVVCSCYTDAVQKEAAQALLAPVRAMHLVGVVGERAAGGVLRHGADVLVRRFSAVREMRRWLG